MARANLDRAGLTDVVDLRVGAALDTLPQIAAEGRGPFDFIFIDADKVNYPSYWTWSLSLSRPGTLIVIDNVVRNGGIVDANSSDANIQGVRRFNELLAAETRVTATAIQTVGAQRLRRLRGGAGQLVEARMAMTLTDGYGDVPPGSSRRSSPRWKCSRPRRRGRKRTTRRDGWELRHVEHPDPDWYHDLFKRVGEDWLWFSRLVMPRQALAAIIHDPLRGSVRAVEGRSRGRPGRTGFPRRR